MDRTQKIVTIVSFLIGIVITTFIYFGMLGKPTTPENVAYMTVLGYVDGFAIGMPISIWILEWMDRKPKA